MKKPVYKDRKVPKFFRKLHKDKLKISKRMKSTRSPEKLINLKKKLILIEAELEENKNDYIRKGKLKLWRI